MTAQSTATLTAEVAGIQSECARHAAAEAEMNRWTREVDRDLARIKFLGVLVLATLGILLTTGRWMMRSAVTEVLVEHGVLSVYPAHSMEGAPNAPAQR